MDLLLQLISKHKLDIRDIEISVLVEQYMAYIQQASEQDLELASEFLEMAARLVYIKTAMLLPRPEEAEELKAELEGQLLEYAVCKQVAEELRERNQGDSILVREPAKLEFDPEYTRNHSPSELVAAYFAAVGKKKRRLPPPASAFKEIVSRRVVSVTSRIIFILRRLIDGDSVSVHSLYEKSTDRSELVATFLAMLELIKTKRVALTADGSSLTALSTGQIPDLEDEAWTSSDFDK